MLLNICVIWYKHCDKKLGSETLISWVVALKKLYNNRAPIKNYLSDRIFKKLKNKWTTNF